MGLEDSYRDYEPLSKEDAQLAADKTRKQLVVIGYAADTQITCENCRENAVCEYAFDTYNTDDDCLAMK